jgi:hypothetical protein
MFSTSLDFFPLTEFAYFEPNESVSATAFIAKPYCMRTTHNVAIRIAGSVLIHPAKTSLRDSGTFGLSSPESRM